jgi:competence protein ComEA
MGITRGLQDRFGFTRNEIKVILFLSVTFVAGSGIRWYRQHVDASTIPVFDYSRSDSEFVARSRAPLSDQTPHLTAGPPRTDRKQQLTTGSINLNNARRLVAYRQEHGPFKSVDDLINVKGIGPKKLEKLRPFLAPQ